MEDAAHQWQGRKEHRSDLASTKITRCEDEYSRIAGSQCANLQRAVSQLLVLSKYNPTPLSDRFQPDAIFFVPSKMVIVNFDGETRVHERRSDWLYA
jgi:hypothetical protein